MQVDEPHVLVLATVASDQLGGVERFSKTLVQALGDMYGAERVGLLGVASAGDEKGLPCTILRVGREPRVEGQRLSTAEKLAYAIDCQRAAFRWRNKRPVIIDCHPWLSSVAWMCARVAGTRYAVWSYGSEVWFPHGALTKFGLHHADLLLSVSSYTARLAEKRARHPSDSALVIPPPFDRSGEPPEREFEGLTQHGRFFLTVGRLARGARRKGIDTIIRALPRVRREAPGARLVVVGEGNDRPRLEQIAVLEGLADDVDFVGAVEDAELAQLYASCEAFVLPSGQEGFGLVYVEAGAHGKPSIAANFGGAPEAVLHGITGFVVPFGDVNGLADSMIELLRDDELRQRMGDAARRLAVKTHSMSAFRANLSNVVDQLGGRYRR